MKTKEAILVMCEVEERNAKREQEWREKQKQEKPLLSMLLVDVYRSKIEVVHIKDDLDEFYRLLRCNTIDIAQRKIGPGTYEVICDDNGLLKGDQRPSAFSKTGDVQFVGNLLVCKYGGAGELAGLDADDIHNLMQNCRYLYNVINGSRRPILFNVEYY